MRATNAVIKLVFVFPIKGGYANESQAVSEANVREVQSHQAQGQGNGYLRKP